VSAASPGRDLRTNPGEKAEGGKSLRESKRKDTLKS
jgi:hypothetical protein